MITFLPSLLFASQTVPLSRMLWSGMLTEETRSSNENARKEKRNKNPQKLKEKKNDDIYLSTFASPYFDHFPIEDPLVFQCVHSKVRLETKRNCKSGGAVATIPLGPGAISNVEHAINISSHSANTMTEEGKALSSFPPQGRKRLPSSF